MQQMITGENMDDEKKKKKFARKLLLKCEFFYNEYFEKEGRKLRAFRND
jgi:hypothetical protein